MRNQILIGLGGTGGKVLKAFRKRLWLDYPDASNRNNLPIGFIYVDSTDEMMQLGDKSFMVMGQNTQFSNDEFVNIKQGVSLNAILAAPQTFPGLSPIVGNGDLMNKTLGDIGKAAGQKRRAGRILFAASCNHFLSTLRAKHTALSGPNGTTDSDIHIFTGLAGGTGSGAILDVVAQIRKTPQFHDPDHTNIMVYAMIPERNIPNGCDAGRYHVNGYAALRELSAFNAGVFLPIDVITGQTIQGIDTTKLNQFGLMLYSNENENNVPAESFEELPELVSNAVYLKMFLSPSPQLDDFRHSFDLENVKTESVEFNSKLGRATERVRTKAINSFGIKRIVYPERRILEHLTYAMGVRLFDQLVYNTFEANTGYTTNSNSLNTNYTDEQHLKNWRLDDSRLSLDEALLETDANFKKREDFWEERSEFLDRDTAFQDDDPLKQLEKLVESVHDGKFRDSLGVENWYQGRKKDTKLGEQASYVVELIERDIFDGWHNGIYSLNNALEIINAIISYVSNRRLKLINPNQGDKQQTLIIIQNYEKEIKDHKSSLMNKGLLKTRLTGGGVYAEHQKLLAQLFSEKTKMAALEFMDVLLVKINLELDNLAKNIKNVITSISTAKRIALNKIDDINAMNANVGIDGAKIFKPTIEIFDVNTMLQYEEKQIIDQATQEAYARIIRDEVVRKANIKGKNYFKKMCQLTEDNFLEILDLELSKNIRATHDNNTSLSSSQKILGLNVLGQLAQLVHIGNDMTKFAQDIVRGCGVYLNFDNTEMMRVLKNNSSPVILPHTMNRKAMIISIPQAQGNNQYRTALEQAFTAAKGTPGPNDTLAFTDSIHDNEMTIMLVKYLFPARVVSWLSQYHDEYIKMVNDSNEQAALEARIMLHSEGEGTNLPNLMGEPILSPKDYIPYLYIAKALGINALGGNALGLLEYGADANGQVGWCQVNRDNYGAKFLVKLSDNFTGIVMSPNVTIATLDYFKDNVEAYFAQRMVSGNDRIAMDQDVVSIVQQYVQQEISNPGSPDYQLYSRAADTARTLINTL